MLLWLLCNITFAGTCKNSVLKDTRVRSFSAQCTQSPASSWYEIKQLDFQSIIWDAFPPLLETWVLMCVSTTRFTKRSPMSSWSVCFPCWDPQQALKWSLKATLHIKLNFSHFLLTSCIIVIDSKDHYIFIYRHSGAIKLLGNYSMIKIMMRHCGKLIYYIFLLRAE